MFSGARAYARKGHFPFHPLLPDATATGGDEGVINNRRGGLTPNVCTILGIGMMLGIHSTSQHRQTSTAEKTYYKHWVEPASDCDTDKNIWQAAAIASREHMGAVVTAVGRPVVFSG